jgi:two-component system alkaline phosphatase synthesis response regulator PhoP
MSLSSLNSSTPSLATILIVEDEENIARGLSFNLKRENYEVLMALDGEMAINLWRTEKIDLIILDLMIPKLHGLEVLKIIRDRGDSIPVFILSAKDQPADKIKGLGLGSDDYLSKPFHLEEFLLRVKKLLQRGRYPLHNFAGPPKQEYAFGKNTIYLEDYKVKNEKGEFNLTSQEMKLMKIFIEHPHTILEKKKLLQEAWGYREGTTSRTIDIFLTRFRKYFEANAKTPKHFLSLRNKGILFRPEGMENPKKNQKAIGPTVKNPPV